MNKDNNGWIKIESEADLPKEESIYYVIDSETKEIVERFYSPNEKNDYFKTYSTHYQPIVKPLKPIY